MAQSWGIRWLLLPVLLLLAPAAQAGTIFDATGLSESSTVSGTAEITLDSNTNLVTVVLTNTTPFTYGAAQLLTGFQFSLDGFSAGSLWAAWAAETVYVSGKHDAGPIGTPTYLGFKDLDTPATWELASIYRLNFNPDADYGIIAPFLAPETDYSGANDSVTGNPGHNPYVYETATFQISVPGLQEDAAISDVVFWFGTDFQGSATPDDPNPPTGIVPLPASAWMGLSFLAVLGVFRTVRRRRVLRAGA